MTMRIALIHIGRKKGTQLKVVTCQSSEISTSDDALGVVVRNNQKFVLGNVSVGTDTTDREN